MLKKDKYTSNGRCVNMRGSRVLNKKINAKNQADLISCWVENNNKNKIQLIK
jgi:hypothetical protein